MSLLLSSLLSALIPVGVEGVKQFVASKTGDIRPTTIDEKIKLDNAEIEKLKAVAALDNPGGTPSQWIIDLRAASRYIAAWLCIILGGVMVFNSTALLPLGGELISVAFGFLFGTRLVSVASKK